jgi:hypothetical protein
MGVFLLPAAAEKDYPPAPLHGHNINKRTARFFSERAAPDPNGKPLF